MSTVTDYVTYKENLQNADNFLLSLVNLIKGCTTMDELRGVTEGTDLYDRLSKVSKLPFHEAQAHLLDRARSLTVQLTYRKQLEAQFAIKQLTCIVAQQDRRINDLSSEVRTLSKLVDNLSAQNMAKSVAKSEKAVAEPKDKTKDKKAPAEKDGTNAGSGE